MRQPANRVLVPAAAAEVAEQSGYGRFPEHIERDWLGRWCHLSEADISLARRRAGDVTRLGFAAQLVTVRAIGTFLADPSAVPAPIVAALARQLDLADPGALTGYGKLSVRWKHTAEIRRRYGYTDFTSQPGHLSLLRWLYRQAWAEDLGPDGLVPVGSPQDVGPAGGAARRAGPHPAGGQRPRAGLPAGLVPARTCSPA